MLEGDNEISFSEEYKSQSTQPVTKSTQQSSNKENEQNITIKVLKENIYHQESDRLRFKLEKEVQLKNEEICEAHKKLKKVQQQLGKANALITKMSAQNEMQKQKNKELARQIQKYQSKHRQIESKQLAPSETAQLKRLKQENSQLHKKIAQTQKENKINVRRIINQSEQIKKSLQSKLQVKSKQQLKIQELLQKKKQEFSQLIEEKDNQIADLVTKLISKDKNIRQLNQYLEEATSKIKQLDSRLIQIQENNKKQCQMLSLKCETFKNESALNQAKHQQYIKKILISLQYFQKHFGSDNNGNSQPLQILENIKKQIIARLQQKETEKQLLQKQNQQLHEAQIQLRQKLSTISSELEKLNSNYKQVKAKSERLQQQLKFIKQRQKNSVNFADIIREHLQQRQATTKKDQQQNHKKDIDCKLKYKITFKDNVPSKKQTNQQLHKPTIQIKLHQLSRKQKTNAMDGFNIKNLQSQQHLKKSTSTQLINFKKTEYDNVVSQLTHKKQSLIYLMYQTQANNSVPKISKTVSKIQQAKPLKRRSNSMSELVRKRCQTNTLNATDSVYNI